MKHMKHPIALLNTSILTTDGEYTMHTIPVDQARELVQDEAGYISAIGHESTASILSTLLGVDVPVNRILFEQAVGQQVIVFKLNGRPPEGQILTEAEIKEIGYSFKLLIRDA